MKTKTFPYTKSLAELRALHNFHSICYVFVGYIVHLHLPGACLETMWTSVRIICPSTDEFARVCNLYLDDDIHSNFHYYHTRCFRVRRSNGALVTFVNNGLVFGVAAVTPALWVPYFIPRRTHLAAAVHITLALVDIYCGVFIIMGTWFECMLYV